MNRQRENHSHETSDRASGNKFQSALLILTTNWRTFRKTQFRGRNPVTFHGTSHPMYATRFVGVYSNVNRRKVHEQDNSQVDGNVSSGSVPFGLCAVWRCHEAGQHETGRQYET